VRSQLSFGVTALRYASVFATAGALACAPVSHETSGASARRPVPTRAPAPGAPAGVTAFVDVGVVPMDTDRVVVNQTVLVEGGRVTAFGPSDQVQVPAGAQRIDGRGKYLMPGMSDCHFHVSPAAWGEWNKQLTGDTIAERRLYRWLSHGVTTVRVPDHYDQTYASSLNTWHLKGTDLLRLRARAAAGELLSPRILASGQWAPAQYKTTRFAPPGGHPVPRLDSVAAYVAAYKAAGYDFLKVRDEPPVIFDSVLAAARRIGMPVVGHVPDNVSLARALAGGMRSIEHMSGYHEALRPDVPDTLRHLPPTQAWLSDTIPALVAATKGSGTWLCVGGGGGGPEGRLLLPSLYKAGVGILVGTDFPLGGSIFELLEWLVAGTGSEKGVGMTPYQALVIATRNMAVYLDQLDESGTVAVGKRADLVLLDGNPLEDIKVVQRRSGVMIGGRWLPGEDLDRRVAEMKAAGGFH
jgi:imidazolonepropionase-like amidohydrolase